MTSYEGENMSVGTQPGERWEELKVYLTARLADCATAVREDDILAHKGDAYRGALAKMAELESQVTPRWPTP